MRLILVTKKQLYGILIVVFVISLVAITLITVKSNTTVTELAVFSPLNKRVIIIDPGHGGIDGGAVGRNTKTLESNINLKIGLKLRQYLEESGCIVIMTRDEDVGLYTDGGTVRKRKNEDLRNRKKIFDDSNADLVVSIHLNSFPQGKYYGAQTFYPQNSPTSKTAAENIQKSLVQILDIKNKRKASLKRDVYIMKNVKTPTIIVECGFLSNSREEILLGKPSYQDKIAWSIYVGLMNYYNNLDQDIK